MCAVMGDILTHSGENNLQNGTQNDCFCILKMFLYEIVRVWLYQCRDKHLEVHAPKCQLWTPVGTGIREAGLSFSTVILLGFF